MQQKLIEIKLKLLNKYILKSMKVQYNSCKDILEHA